HRRLPPAPLFPYTTLFRSLGRDQLGADHRVEVLAELAPGRRQVTLAHPDQATERTVLAVEAAHLGWRHRPPEVPVAADVGVDQGDRKSTRLNSSHVSISYA